MNAPSGIKRILSFDVGVRNLAYCLVSYTPPPLDTTTNDAPDLAAAATVLSIGSLDLTRSMAPSVNTTNVNKIPILALCRALFRSLGENVDAITGGTPVDYVVIENQPCLKNPRMKSIQMALYSFFVLRFLPPTADDRPATDICMFQPRDKLSVYSGDPVTCTLKSKYSRRKFLSVRYTESMLARRMEVSPDDADTKRCLDHYRSLKKKDDPADAYLQALTFVRQRLLKKPKKKKATRRRKPKKATGDAGI